MITLQSPSLSQSCWRVNALCRRPPTADEYETLTCGDLEMNLTYRSVVRCGKRIDLLPLSAARSSLAQQAAVVPRTMLLERVWNFNFDPNSSVVETYISRLRAKIDKPFCSALIHTVRKRLLDPRSRK